MGLFKKKKKSTPAHKMIVEYGGAPNYDQTVPVAYKMKGEKKWRRAVGLVETLFELLESNVVGTPKFIDRGPPPPNNPLLHHNAYVNKNFLMDVYDPLEGSDLLQNKDKRSAIESMIITNLYVNELNLSTYVVFAPSKDIVLIGRVNHIFLVLPPRPTTLRVSERGDAFPENFFFYGSLRSLYMLPPFRLLRVPNSTTAIHGSSNSSILNLEHFLNKDRADIRLT